jgi:hypothetical protein
LLGEVLLAQEISPPVLVGLDEGSAAWHIEGSYLYGPAANTVG